MVASMRSRMWIQATNKRSMFCCAALWWGIWEVVRLAQASCWTPPQNRTFRDIDLVPRPLSRPPRKRCASAATWSQGHKSWESPEHCFFRGSGLIHCWGGYAGGFAGPEFVEGLASRGFAARLWLRGVASPGFADVCSQTSLTFAPPCC